MNVAIVGCGFIGVKRAHVFREVVDDKLVVVCDIDKVRTETLAKDFGCSQDSSWERVVGRPDIDAVCVSTINALLEPVTVAALESGKHVLCEKPLGRNASESHHMVEVAERQGVVLRTGFNHRFHPSIARAKQLLDEGRIGKCLNMRARYGHGSRPGMEGEWRASKKQSGGGELLDQGVHIIDLIRWMGGEIKEVLGKAETLFWNIEVEDNAFAFLKTERDISATFHVSWTNWKNIFSFEIFGTGGYMTAQGLGGSYGPETLEVGLRKSEGGKPDIEVIDFPADDRSWKLEWLDFRDSIIPKGEHPPYVPKGGSGRDGLRANQVVEALYESSRMNALVRL